MLRANTIQRGNPLIKHLKSALTFEDILPDFAINKHSCALFLSLKYHALNPEYLNTRIHKLGQGYKLRILLVLVDADHTNCTSQIRELTREALMHNFTLVCSWSEEDAAKYLDLFVTMDGKPPDLITAKIDSDDISKITAALTEIKSVNKTDVMTLVLNYGSLKKIIHANGDQIALLPGFGTSKTKRLMDAFDAPFKLS